MARPRIAGTPLTSAERVRRTHDRRRQRGLCITCGVRRAGRTQRCADCRARHKEYCCEYMQRRRTGNPLPDAGPAQ